MPATRVRDKLAYLLRDLLEESGESAYIDADSITRNRMRSKYDESPSWDLWIRFKDGFQLHIHSYTPMNDIVKSGKAVWVGEYKRSISGMEVCEKPTTNTKALAAKRLQAYRIRKQNEESPQDDILF